MRFDAVVIGSGPAGATVARLLAQTGRSVALIERADFPRRKVCGEFISAATMPVLETCGVAGDFLALAGPPVRTIAGYAGDTMVEAPLPQAKAGWGRALGREHLDILLRDAAVAAGAKLFQPAEVTALRREADGHVLSLRREETDEEISAPVVIAACGSWNAKGPFAITDKPRASDLLAFKAHFRGSALPEGVMPLLAFPGGYGGLVHSDAGRISLSCCIRRDALTRARAVHGGKAGEAVLGHVLASSVGVRRALQDATVEGAILSSGPIRPGIRARYRDGVFFAGNLAGEAHPLIAEGISMAIQSSWLLAQSLIAAGPAAAGAQYARAWKDHFALRLRASALFAHLAMNDHSRAAAALVIGAFPNILTWGAALSGKAAAMPSHRRETAIGIRHDAA